MEYAQINQFANDQSFLKNVLIILGMSILFGISAWISIPLPFTPVPLVISSQLIIFSSVLLGKKGTYATFAYLAQGAMGFPVFARGGSGIAYLLGPTGGYLIGLAIASFVVGTFSDRIKGKSSSKTFGLMLAGNALLFIFGLPHLALLVGWKNALNFGLYPFIAGDLFKLILAQRALKALKFFDAP